MSGLRSLLVISATVFVASVVSPAAWAQQPMVVVPGQVYTQPVLAYTLADLNLRSGAGNQYAVIAVMPRGVEVVVYDCPNAYWCNVQWQGFVGFASPSYLAVAGPQVPTIVMPPPRRGLFPLFGPRF